MRSSNKPTVVYELVSQGSYCSWYLKTYRGVDEVCSVVSLASRLVSEVYPDQKFSVGVLARVLVEVFGFEYATSQEREQSDSLFIDVYYVTKFGKANRHSSVIPCLDRVGLDSGHGVTRGKVAGLLSSLGIHKVVAALAFLLLVLAPPAEAGNCHGRFPNPITDICWTCIFPIQIGGITLNASSETNNGDPAPPWVCNCPAPPPIFQRIGVGISFWEPARVAEVVRSPMCSPTLNGSPLGSALAPDGTNHNRSGDGENGYAFYHVHWIQYPVLNWLGMAITQGACFINESFDMAYMSELDPLWDDDELSFILSPEAALFGSVPAQAACIADSVKAAVTGFGLDALFWCSGSQGSLYPISGAHAAHVGGVDSSLALTHTMIFKLHRELLAQDTSTYGAICGGVPQPLLRKTQYKQQMMYPIPQNIRGYGFGAPSTFWGAAKEFPYKGEDFSYLVWRKRQCCAF